MPYDIRTKESVIYRMMNTPFYCSAACAQMVLGSPGINAPLIVNGPGIQGLEDPLQDWLFKQTVMFTSPDRFVDWTAGPDGVSTTLRIHDPRPVNRYAIKALTNLKDLERWMIWSIQTHGLPLVALTGVIKGFDHWVVIHGCLVEKLSENPTSDPGEISGFFVHNPNVRVRPPDDNSASNPGKDYITPNPDGSTEWVTFVTQKAWAEIYMSGRTPLDRRRYVSVLIPHKDRLESANPPKATKYAPGGVPLPTQPDGQAISVVGPAPITRDLTTREAKILEIAHSINFNDVMKAIRVHGLQAIQPWKETIQLINKKKLQPKMEVHPVVVYNADNDETIDGSYFLILLEVSGSSGPPYTPIVVVATKEEGKDLIVQESMAVPQIVGNALLVPSYDIAKKEVIGKAAQKNIRIIPDSVLRPGPPRDVQLTISIDPSILQTLIATIPTGVTPPATPAIPTGVTPPAAVTTDAPKEPILSHPFLIWSASFQTTSRFQPFYWFTVDSKPRKQLRLRIDSIHTDDQISNPNIYVRAFTNLRNGRKQGQKFGRGNRPTLGNTIRFRISANLD